MLALQEQVAVLQEITVYLLCGKRWQGADDRFVAVFAAWGGAEAGKHRLGGSHKSHGKLTGPLYVLVGSVGRCANETKMILPAHRHGQGFGGQV